MDIAQSNNVRLLLHVVDSSGSGVTGLGVGDFTWEVYDSGLSAYGDPDQLDDVGSGVYWVRFDNMTQGLWSVWVQHATHFPEGKTAKVHVFDTLFDELAQATADAVLDEPLAGHTTTSTFGFLLNVLKAIFETEALTVQTGSTTTAVRTNCAKATGFYSEGCALLVINAAGVAVRRVTAYSNTNGEFTVDTAFPFTPANTNLAVVIAQPWASEGQLDTVYTDLDGKLDDVIGDLAGVAADVDAILIDTGTTIPAQITSEINDVQTDVAGIEMHLDAIDGNLGTINSSVTLAVLQTDADAIAAAVWDALTGDFETLGTFGELVGRILVPLGGLGTVTILDQSEVIAGSSTTEVRTDDAHPTGYWDGHVLVVALSGGTVARRIVSYNQTNGAYTVEPALPSVPTATIQVYVTSPPQRTDAQLDARVQAALTAQGYTAPRAALLDNLDVTVSSRASASALADLQADVDAILADTSTDIPALIVSATNSVLAAIAALNNLSEADVQAALTAQGLTTIRAALLDNLDAAVSSVLTALAAHDAASPSHAQTGLTAQGYTVTRAAKLDTIDGIFAGTETGRKVLANKVVISPDDLTVTVYEDDGTTPFLVFTISADGREREPV